MDLDISFNPIRRRFCGSLLEQHLQIFAGTAESYRGAAEAPKAMALPPAPQVALPPPLGSASQKVAAAAGGTVTALARCLSLLAAAVTICPGWALAAAWPIDWGRSSAGHGTEKPAAPVAAVLEKAR